MVHSEHLKPYVQPDRGEDTVLLETEERQVENAAEEDTQPPRDALEARSDPPSEREEPPAGESSRAKSPVEGRRATTRANGEGERRVALVPSVGRKRGRPKKSRCVVVRSPPPNPEGVALPAETTERRPRGRPRKT